MFDINMAANLMHEDPTDDQGTQRLLQLAQAQQQPSHGFSFSPGVDEPSYWDKMSEEQRMQAKPGYLGQETMDAVSATQNEDANVAMRAMQQQQPSKLPPTGRGGIMSEPADATMYLGGGR
jgi:hypothetical protein